MMTWTNSFAEITWLCWLYLTVVLRGRAGYELIYITNEAVAHIRQFRAILLIFSGETSSNRDIFFTEDAAKNFFPTSKISARVIHHQFFLIWSNLTIMDHIMGLGNQSEGGKSLSWAKNLLKPCISYILIKIVKPYISKLNLQLLCLSQWFKLDYNTTGSPTWRVCACSTNKAAGKNVRHNNKFIQLSPEREVNSFGYIPRREASRYTSSALHRPWGG